MQVGAVRILAATHQIEGADGGVDIEVAWEWQNEANTFRQVTWAYKSYSPIVVPGHRRLIGP